MFIVAVNVSACHQNDNLFFASAQARRLEALQRRFTIRAGSGRDGDQTTSPDRRMSAAATRPARLTETNASSINIVSMHEFPPQQCGATPIVPPFSGHRRAFRAHLTDYANIGGKRPERFYWKIADFPLEPHREYARRPPEAFWGRPAPWPPDLINQSFTCSAKSRPLGNRLTVDPRTLTPLVLVRIQVPQPKFGKLKQPLR